MHEDRTEREREGVVEEDVTPIKEDMTPQHQKGNVGADGDRNRLENKVELEI